MHISDFLRTAHFQDYVDTQGHLVGNEDSGLEKKSVSFSPHLDDNDIIDTQQVLSEFNSHSAPIDC